MSADPSEGRERAAFEEWCPIKILDPATAPKANALVNAYWTAWQAGRRSLEQERWISVEERLPEPGHIVLAYCNDKIIDTAWLTDEEKQNWYLERTSPQDEPITYPVRDGYVTHWHELPAPPVPKGDS